ncbi:MAG: GGDEF domain-containing protein [Bacillota bacterium]|nr:GGDEF domain-containing protein [Bacillota bacterium]
MTAKNSAENEKWEMQILGNNGDMRWISGVSSYDKANDTYSAIILDATKEVERAKREQAQEELMKLLNESGNTIIFDYDVEKDIMVKDVYGTVDGLKRMRKTNYMLSENGDVGYMSSENDGFRSGLRKAITLSGKGSFEFRADYDGKGLRWKRAHYSVLGNDKDGVYRIIGRIEDIDEKLKLLDREAKWKKRAQHDHLTGLYSRRTGIENIRRMLQGDRPEGMQVMFLMDIDDFKAVNDTYGHIEGDNLLKGVGTLLKTIFRGDDILFRYGGDEIVAVVNGMPDRETIEEKARNILRSITRLHTIGGQQIHCSIGIAIRTDEAYPDQLFEKADRAMYRAKHAGKNCFVVE